MAAGREKRMEKGLIMEVERGKREKEDERQKTGERDRWVCP